MPEYIIDEIEISFDDSNKDDSDDKKLNIEIFLEKYKEFFRFGTKKFIS